MRQLLDTAAEVASAMAYLHSRTIVHGDLKTANVLLQVGYGTSFCVCCYR